LLSITYASTTPLAVSASLSATMGAYASLLSSNSAALSVDKDIVLVDQRHYAFQAPDDSSQLAARPSFLFFVNSLFAHLPDTKKRVVKMALDKYIYSSESLATLVEFLELPASSKTTDEYYYRVCYTSEVTSY
jgi:hypothetical protein